MPLDYQVYYIIAVPEEVINIMLSSVFVQVNSFFPLSVNDSLVHHNSFSIINYSNKTTGAEEFSCSFFVSCSKDNIFKLMPKFHFDSGNEFCCDQSLRNHYYNIKAALILHSSLGSTGKYFYYLEAGAPLRQFPRATVYYTWKEIQNLLRSSHSIINRSDPQRGDSVSSFIRWFFPLFVKKEADRIERSSDGGKESWPPLRAICCPRLGNPFLYVQNLRE